MVFSLPGPPGELQPMALKYVVDAIELRRTGDRVITQSVHMFGLGESRAAALLGDMMDRQRVPTVGTTASEGIISARIRAIGSGPSLESRVEADAERIEQLWKQYAFGRGDETLPTVIGGLLERRGKTLATAESCTGGWLGKLLVDVPGSSDYYTGGWVTYSNKLKTQEFGVSDETLARFGAVSREVASAMAEGAARRANADYAIAITGVAGPDGGTQEKPVGCVYIGVAARNEGKLYSSVRRFQFTGDRSSVRLRSAQASLQMLRFLMLDVSDRLPLLWEVREGR
jgi:nicotinamide-nucleotide amidase